MKHDSLNSKANRQTERAVRHDSSMGEHAIALAPPAYGIEVVDRGLVAAGATFAAGFGPGSIPSTATAVQRQAMPEEGDPLQGKFDAVAAEPVRAKPESAPNWTGMQDPLKTGIEALSGLDLSDVRVHINSAKPAKVNALAYAHGNDIYLGPGQERHLPHEAWHVVQQRQRWVQPTLQAKGVQINDDPRLEKEAEVMGQKANRVGSVNSQTDWNADSGVVQQNGNARGGQAAPAIDSLAFTVKRDLIFLEGQHQPHTSRGQYLLAPELAHPIQQDCLHNTLTSAQLAISDDLSLERQTDEAARLVMGHNTATSTLSINGSNASAIQRYEAGEHAQFGGREGDKMEYEINGVKVTYSELIALGDLYEGPEQMWKEAKKDPARFQNLINLIKQDRDYYEKRIGKKVEEHEWQTATGRRYLDLAGKNIEHFAGRNIDKWQQLHTQALMLAASGHTDKAMQVNAFADHYLTDAFSAGHLIDKVKIMKSAQARLQGNDIKYYYTLRLAEALMAHPKVASQLRNYEVQLGIGTWVPVTSESLATVLRTVERYKSDKFYSGFAKAVHDWLNRDIGRSFEQRLVENKRIGLSATPTPLGKDQSSPSTGAAIWVINDRGDKWLLSGDTTLGFSPETLKIGREAVKQSRENIEWAGQQASTIKDRRTAERMVTLQLPNLFNKVKAYLPRPVESTKEMIEAVEQTIGNPRDPESIEGLATISVENVETLINELVDNDLIRLKTKATAR